MTNNEFVYTFILLLFLTQVNGFSYCNQTLIILFNVTQLFAHSYIVPNIALHNYQINYTFSHCLQYS